MRGRKPVPTHLKLLRGNPGRRPINDQEPQPDAIFLDPPQDLSEVARKEWGRVARDLFDLGIVTKLGTIIKTKKGNIIQNPYLAVENKAMEQMKAFMVELGLSPSSRSRVKIGRKKPIDPLSEFQKRRQQHGT